ncbi:apolipoprotein N-acyltransferase [Microcella humidisoli]|uniref:Apolipoprotein N-acyltransferase n=1 Tax=Microcella humidisoli TaxID=2963406 RepID=A0ABY5FVH2_9MICO|nr:apolipoprotein N-acyltransferase [Microcella humidisoli]UTT62248.1 apolipoprotein N-acyltransferase [Microcella humidisoli]
MTSTIPADAGRATARPLSLDLALLAAIVGGWFMDLGYPDIAWWPFTIVGTALVLASLRGRSIGGALLVGAVSGFAYYGILIEWLTVYLGIVPWLALTLAQVFFTALGGVLIMLAWRWVPRAWPGVAGRLILTPAVVAAAWTAREAVASVFPFGGFAWGRLAHSQAEGPLNHWAAWVGFSGLTFLLAWFSAMLVAVVIERRVGMLRRGILVAGAFTALLVWPAVPIATTGTISVAAVQGDSDSGLFAEYEQGQILQDHYDATRTLFDQGLDLDVVVWPENASDLDPLRSEYAASVLDLVSDRLEAPVVVGTITVEGDETFNSVLLWRAGEGSVDQYDKVHPVPFAEYLPARDFFYPLAPSLFDLVPRDYSFGQRDTVVDLDGVIAGISICYDIVDDDLLARQIDEGAQVLLAPTNNADFGVSDQSVQQLAIARLRAIESGRALVNASTVGASAIVLPDGSTLDSLPLFEPGTMVQQVPLSDTVTPAHALGRTLEWGVILFGLLTITLAGLLIGRGGRARARVHEEPDGPR